MTSRAALLALVAALAVDRLPAAAGRAQTPDTFVVGAVEDAAKSGPADAKMLLARQAGYRAIVLSAVWTPPLEAPPAAELAALENAVIAAATNGIRPIVAVYSFSSVTPTTPEARAQFAAYAASIPRLAAGRPRRDRRQRAEPEPVLAAAVRPRRVGRRGGLVPRAARGVLRRAQGRLPGHQRHRRLAVGARERRPRWLRDRRTPRRDSSRTSGPSTGPRGATSP